MAPLHGSKTGWTWCSFHMDLLYKGEIFYSLLKMWKFSEVLYFPNRLMSTTSLEVKSWVIRETAVLKSKASLIKKKTKLEITLAPEDFFTYKPPCSVPNSSEHKLPFINKKLQFDCLLYIVHPVVFLAMVVYRMKVKKWELRRSVVIFGCWKIS